MKKPRYANQIDSISKKEILEMKDRFKGMSEKDKLIECGRKLCMMWLIHWNGEDAQYLLNKIKKHL